MLEKEIKSVNTEKRSIQSELDDTRSKISRLNNEIKNSKEAQSDQISSYKTLTKTIEDKDYKISSLELLLSDLEVKLKASDEDRNEDIDTLNRLKEFRDKSNKENIDLQNRLDEATISLKKCRKELEYRSDSCFKLEEDNFELKERLKDQHNDFKKLQTSIDQKSNSSNEEAIILRRQIETANEDINKLQNSLHNLKDENFNLTQKLEEVEGEKRRLVSDKLKLEQKVEDADSEDPDTISSFATECSSIVLGFWQNAYFLIDKGNLVFTMGLLVITISHILDP